MKARWEFPRRRALHGAAVVLGYSLFVTWLFSRTIISGAYLADSDLYEYYLPIFLAPITNWSSFEFSGLPAFADPGDFTSYPPHFFFARIVGSWTAMVASAFVLAAVFTYAYVYRVTRSRTAAAFAGIAYGFSEAMLERIPHLGTLHCFAWLPLILLAVDEVRDGPRRLAWTAIGAVALACAFLSGHPQPAVYTFYATGLYALTRGLTTRAPRAFFVTIAAMFALSGLLAGIKALPLVEASTVMARQQVNYGQFAGHGNTPAEMLSALFPTMLHDGREAPTYVGLAVLAFAAIGVWTARRDSRALFWIVASVFALLMGMGDATPVPRMAFAVVPLYTKFRVGARHLFLFAFGAAFLAGRGIAAIQSGAVSRRQIRVGVAVLVALLAAGAAAQALWPSAFVYEVRRRPELTLPVWPTSVWIQLLIGMLVAITIWMMSMRRVPALFLAALIILVTDDLYSFPSTVTTTGIDAGTIPRAAAGPSVHAMQLQRDLAPLEQRALAIGGTQYDAVVPAAFARVWKIPIAGGYGPMLLERYSQLASMGTNGSIRPNVLAPYDTALDMMAVKYILVRDDDVRRPKTFDADGLEWDQSEFGVPVGRPDCHLPYVRRTVIPAPADVPVSAIGLVTHLRCSEDLVQGAPVATIRVVDSQGRVVERAMHAGIDTADVAVADPEQAGRLQHQRPPHAVSGPGDERAPRFLTRVALDAPGALRHIEIETPVSVGWLSIDRLTFVDAMGHSHPAIAPATWLDDGDRWRPLRRFATSRVTDRRVDESQPSEAWYTVLENRRALPRAWIVPEVVSVEDRDAVEAVHRGFLPDGRRFDPRQIAMVSPDEGAAPGPFTPGSAQATVQRIEDGRITVVATSSGGGFLVLSETDYPGWRARIDGNPAMMRRTNVALQGVAIPAGTHTVEFELVSTTQRAGIAMSIIGLLVCAGLVMADWT